jgi:hypothetical protein
MEAWWNDLASTDEGRASRALLGFATRGKESTAFFKEHLKPVKADLDTIKKLIVQLDGKRFAVREAAFKKLTGEVDYLGKSARPILEQTIKGDGSAEVKKRLGELLELVAGDGKTPAPPPMPPVLQGKSIGVSSGPGGIKIIVDGQAIDLSAMSRPTVVAPRVNTQWLRAVRTVALLETFGTPEARAVLEALAGGVQDTVPTQEAKAALERLGKAK